MFAESNKGQINPGHKQLLADVTRKNI